MHWGAYISDARTRAGLTVDQLGERSGFAAALITEWEYERACPNVDEWVRVLAAAGYAPVVRLVEDDGVDITQIERSLGMTPVERVRNVTAAVAFAGRTQKAMKAAQAKRAIRS